MSKRIFVAISLILATCAASYSQAPVIQKIEPRVSFPKSTVVISGSGFSSNASQLQVWFDQVKAKIITCSDFSIEAEVPAEARLDNIRVVNLTSKLSAQSDLKYMPVFSGEGFDPAKLTAPLSIGSANAIFDIISLDVDGDNRPDLIGTRNEATATTMALMMNQSSVGNISFVNTDIPGFNVNAPTGHLATGDINGDGKPDVVASRSGATANTVFVLINTSTTGSPSFAAPIILSLDATHLARQVEIDDLNGDGKPEVIVANSTTNDLYIFRNESNAGTTSINPTPVKFTVTGASQTLALEVQDYDRDGKKDIIATQFNNVDLYILKNTSAGSSFNFTVSKITVVGQFNDVTSADFNNDGKLDIVATSLFSAQAQVFLNQTTSGSIAFSAFPITVTTDSQPFGIDVSDLNGDGFADFIIPSRGVNTLTAFINNANTSSVGFTKVVVPTAKTNWFVRAGDLDGDAKPDIAFTSFSGTNFSVDILRNKNCHKPKILNATPLSICASQTIRLNTIPIPGVTFNWSNGFSSIKNSADPFAEITAAATYTVTAVGEGTSCSVTSASVVVNSGAGTVPTDPVITTNAPVCAGSALTLSTTAVSGATYAWTGPNNFTGNLQSINIPNATTANAGIYTLTVKVGDCSSNTVTKNIDIVSFGSFSITSSSASNLLCQGQTLTLSINSATGYSYQWMKDNANISGQTSTSLVVSQDGAYKVKVTNTALSCSQETAPVTVTVYSAPSASFTTTPTAACVGTSVQFTNNSTVDTRITSPIISWDFGDSQTSVLPNPAHTYTSAATFAAKLTVSYTGVTTCTNSVTKNIVVSAATAPVITATKTEICQDEVSTLSVTGTYTSYLWSTTAITPTIDVTSPNTYSVTTTDANGCKGDATITLAAKTDCTITPTGLVFPPVFSPNGDTKNDNWIIQGIDQYGDCTMSIFDGNGRRLFQVTGYPIEGWDGNYEGKEAPQGTYYFVFSCPNETPKTGSFLIVR